MTSLSVVLAGARRVRVVAGGTFDHRHRNAQETLAAEDDPEAVASLREALQTARDDDGFSFMTPGDVTFAFYGEGHDLLATVTYLAPDFIRWRGADHDLQLSDGPAVWAWLVRGVGSRPPDSGKCRSRGGSPALAQKARLGR
jgi:hypothetical protein